MRINGVLTYLVEVKSDFDTDGTPVFGAPHWSAPIPCLIKVNSHSEKGKYQDGFFTQASYEVLLERQYFSNPISRVRIKRSHENDLTFITNYVKFFASDGSLLVEDDDPFFVKEESRFEDLGEWEVQSFETLVLDRIKVTV